MLAEESLFYVLVSSSSRDNFRLLGTQDHHWQRDSWRESNVVNFGTSVFLTMSDILFLVLDQFQDTSIPLYGSHYCLPKRDAPDQLRIDTAICLFFQIFHAG